MYLFIIVTLIKVHWKNESEDRTRAEPSDVALLHFILIDLIKRGEHEDHRNVSRRSCCVEIKVTDRGLIDEPR